MVQNVAIDGAKFSRAASWCSMLRLLVHRVALTDLDSGSGRAGEVEDLPGARIPVT
jgi:hypothetical protein